MEVSSYQVCSPQFPDGWPSRERTQGPALPASGAQTGWTGWARTFPRQWPPQTLQTLSWGSQSTLYSGLTKLSRTGSQRGHSEASQTAIEQVSLNMALAQVQSLDFFGGWGIVLPKSRPEVEDLEALEGLFEIAHLGLVDVLPFCVKGAILRIVGSSFTGELAFWKYCCSSCSYSCISFFILATCSKSFFLICSRMALSSTPPFGCPGCILNIKFWIDIGSWPVTCEIIALVLWSTLLWKLDYLVYNN